jgi:hypothetical protein
VTGLASSRGGRGTEPERLPGGGPIGWPEPEREPGGELGWPGDLPR